MKIDYETAPLHIDRKYIGCQFLIMDYLPGEILQLVFDQNTPIVLGKTHDVLHNADSIQLKKDYFSNICMQTDFIRRFALGETADACVMR